MKPAKIVAGLAIAGGLAAGAVGIGANRIRHGIRADFSWVGS